MAEDESDVPLLFSGPGPSEGRNWKLFNIIVLGVSFMFLFTAFQTCSMVETIVLESEVRDSHGTFNGKGYTSLAIIYGSFAVSNWLAPSIVAVFGAKMALIGGAILYCAYIALFLKPLEVTLYLFSALVGLGAAVLWTAQGNLLTINSTTETRGRDTGIFWALMQCSLLIGNLFFFFEFKNATDIDASKRLVLFGVLTVVAVIGMLIMFLIRNLAVVQQNTSDLQSQERSPTGPLEALKRSLQMFITKEMLLLSFCFAYTGLELSYWSGIYGTSVGHTSSYGDTAKQLTGLTGVFVGIGEICGGAMFGLIGNRHREGFGRDSVIFFGYVIHIICFFLIFINSPDESPLQDTLQIAFLVPNEYLAMFCAFLLGLGDSSFNTQIYPLLGALYPQDSASAFAIFKFIQSLASAMAFVYGKYLVQKWHLLILTAFGTLGSIFFFVVERASRRKVIMNESEILRNS